MLSAFADHPDDLPDDVHLLLAGPLATRETSWHCCARPRSARDRRARFSRPASLAASQAQGRYTISSDGQEVTDTTTKLAWRRCAEGLALGRQGVHAAS